MKFKKITLLIVTFTFCLFLYGCKDEVEYDDSFDYVAYYNINNDIKIEKEIDYTEAIELLERAIMDDRYQRQGRMTSELSEDNNVVSSEFIYDFIGSKDDYRVSLTTIRDHETSTLYLKNGNIIEDGNTKTCDCLENSMNDKMLFIDSECETTVQINEYACDIYEIIKENKETAVYGYDEFNNLVVTVEYKNGVVARLVIESKQIKFMYLGDRNDKNHYFWFNNYYGKEQIKLLDDIK